MIEPNKFNVKQVSRAVPVESPAPQEATIAILARPEDLTARKLLPALYILSQEGYLTDRAPIIGLARREKTDESFRNEMFEAVSHHSRTGPVTAEQWQKFARRLFYRRVDLENADDFTSLRPTIEEIERNAGGMDKRMFYLATSPELFLPSVSALARAGLVPAPDDKIKLRVVFEKPFGRDLDSARELTKQLAQHLTEEQIFRIDHYLGKETVQNILLFRFGNSIFEPLLNRNHVDHVQITVAESQGIERGRGAYYDSAGALRDVMQNHVLQLLCLLAMEPPALFADRGIHDEKLKVLQALAPGDAGDISRWAVAGQYVAAAINGDKARGYREEDRVDPKSTTETYAALKVGIDNWRWAGVPFYLRTGKRMPNRVTEIAIQFKLPPLHLFTTVECEGDFCDLVGARPNTLVFRIQPDESIGLSFSTKRPGMQYQIQPVAMDFEYESTFERGLPEAYERLLLDVLRGDSTLFTRSDELEAAWQFITPILRAWESPQHSPATYPAGTWGPEASDALLAATGHHWRMPTQRELD